MKKTAPRSSLAPSNSRGIALIEALIGVLLFLIGILGLIAMQANMTKAQGSAKFRADAAALSAEAFGVMWTDKPNLSAYNDGAGKCDAHTPCKEWKRRVASKLPNGSAEISASGTGAVAVTLTWSTAAEGTHTYATETAITY